MKDKYSLIITVPSGDTPLIEYGRHFAVNGRIEYREPVPDDAVLTVRLLDSQGKIVRHTCQHQKNNPNMFAYHPQLTGYKEELDPGRKAMKKFGFAELMVQDMEHPDMSMRDATIKCFYTDEMFKAIIVSGTDVEHGMIFDDGIGLVDENGIPYNVLPKGDYKILVELTTREGMVLAQTAKQIVISGRENQVICRFNPIAHRQNMEKWCEQIGVTIVTEPMPGYLDAYLGRWFYHMGLLTMYRANDIALYNGPKIHMFVYLVDPTSTSYETELAFLQTKGVVAEPERFQAYHYDIGEALIGKGKAYEQSGKIVKFAPDAYLDICRVDVVNQYAKENVFHLNEEALISAITDLNNIELHVGDKIAITGVVRPWQLDAKYFRLKEDNTYEITNSVNKLHYTFDDGTECKIFERELMMERIDEESIGCSVYEFYNIFSIDENMVGKRIKIHITACDNEGEKKEATDTIIIKVLSS